MLKKLSKKQKLSPEGSSFVVENDPIKFEHNGKEIIGEVQHVVHHMELGLMEVTLLCELGLEKFKIDRQKILNQTILDEKQKEKRWWNIYTSVPLECKDDDLMKMKGEIKDILKARDELKYSLVSVAVYPKKEIIVASHVACSKLKTPRFEHYMEVRKNVLSVIDEIRRKYGGIKEEGSSHGD